MSLTLNQAFDPRSNSIGFLRWLLAFAVIFSHAGPLAGFYGGHDLGLQLSTEQSLGGVAVAGFFFVSGFLITRSRMGRSTVFRYFWRRVLRIFPAFWAALLVTAFVFGPIAWRVSTGSFQGYFGAKTESPLTYVPNNMFLALNQRNLAGMGDQLPYAQTHGARDWNGSAWTLIYEFKGYILIALLGLFGFLAYRWLAASVAMFIIFINFMVWSGAGSVLSLSEKFGNIFNFMFLAPFAFGILFSLFGDRIRIDDRVAVAAAGMAGGTYAWGGWNIWGQFAFCYVLMWCAVRLPLRNWEKHGDLSYGIYIFAWPTMTLAAFFGVHQWGWLPYHLVIVIAVHAVAYVSWHVIESPAMSLKNWTPRWMAALIARGAPTVERVKRTLVNPDYSSSNFAKKLRTERATAGEPADDAVAGVPVDLVPAPAVPAAGDDVQASRQPTGSDERSLKV